MHFANYLGLINDKATFEAIDGVHHAHMKNGLIYLQMQDVSVIEKVDSDVILDTGSPHLVRMTSNLRELDVRTEGAKIRYSDPFSQNGINVNFVEKLGANEFEVRTYERGVENETLSCGTGVTAIALAMFSEGQTKSQFVKLQTQGGVSSHQ